MTWPALIGAALSVAGCGSPYMWDRPGVTVAQAAADQKDCRDAARRGTRVVGGYSDGTVAGSVGAGIGSGVARSIEKRNDEVACLEARGYVRQTITSEELAGGRALEGEQRDAYAQQLLEKYGSVSPGATVATQPLASVAPAAR